MKPGNRQLFDMVLTCSKVVFTILDDKSERNGCLSSLRRKGFSLCTTLIGNIDKQI